MRLIEPNPADRQELTYPAPEELPHNLIPPSSFKYQLAGFSSSCVVEGDQGVVVGGGKGEELEEGAKNSKRGAAGENDRKKEKCVYENVYN